MVIVSAPPEHNPHDARGIAADGLFYGKKLQFRFCPYRRNIIGGDTWASAGLFTSQLYNQQMKSAGYSIKVRRYSTLDDSKLPLRRSIQQTKKKKVAACGLRVRMRLPIWLSDLRRPSYFASSLLRVGDVGVAA